MSFCIAINLRPPLRNHLEELGNGAKRQKWETYGSHAEAKKRKAEIEHQIDTGMFIPPNATTLSDFLDEYVSLYGVSTWAPSTFDGHTALISNYIKPIIGDVKLDDITPRLLTRFYKDLQTVKAVSRYGHPDGELISPNTICLLYTSDAADEL